MGMRKLEVEDGLIKVKCLFFKFFRVLIFLVVLVIIILVY